MPAATVDSQTPTPVRTRAAGRCQARVAVQPISCPARYGQAVVAIPPTVSPSLWPARPISTNASTQHRSRTTATRHRLRLSEVPASEARPGAGPVPGQVQARCQGRCRAGLRPVQGPCLSPTLNAVRLDSGTRGERQGLLRSSVPASVCVTGTAFPTRRVAHLPRSRRRVPGAASAARGPVALWGLGGLIFLSLAFPVG